MNETDHMTAWEFLRWFAANHSRSQLAIVAATVTICTLFVGTVPLAWGMPAWAAIVGIIAVLVADFAVGWLMLGSHRVQRWIIGM